LITSVFTHPSLSDACRRSASIVIARASTRPTYQVRSMVAIQFVVSAAVACNDTADWLVLVSYERWRRRTDDVWKTWRRLSGLLSLQLLSAANSLPTPTRSHVSYDQTRTQMQACLQYERANARLQGESGGSDLFKFQQKQTSN